MKKVNVNKVLENLDKVVENLGMTDDGGRKITKLADYQKEIVKAILSRKHRLIAVCASTQVGKSTSVMVSALLAALLYDGEEIWIVSPAYSQSVSKFNFIKRAIEGNPVLYQLVDFSKPFRRDCIAFKNGSVIRCLSAGARRGLLGYSATFLIIDEAQEIPDEIWRTRLLRMVVGSGMKNPPIVVLIGTANRINFFRDAFLSDDWWKKKITWKDGVKAGILRPEIVEFARKSMTPSEFKAWYEAEFDAGAGKLFDLAKVRDLMKLRTRILRKEEGWRIFGGLDVARLGEDESCIVFIRIPRYARWGDVPAEMMFYETRYKKNLADIIGWATKFIEKYDPEVFGVDETQLGAGVLDILRERFGGKVVGVKFAGREREEVYKALYDAIENKLIYLLNDSEIASQFEGYDVEYRSDGSLRIKKAPGRRDDIVDALAIAVYLASLERRGVTISVWEDFLRWVK
ncbi:hypothetical protein DRN93_04340 [archaeon]|nr:MAG: hypothetical protein DRN93_04340 [archaeon]